MRKFSLDIKLSEADEILYYYCCNIPIFTFNITCYNAHTQNEDLIYVYKGKQVVIPRHHNTPASDAIRYFWDDDIRTICKKRAFEKL